VKAGHSSHFRSGGIAALFANAFAGPNEGKGLVGLVCQGNERKTEGKNSQEKGLFQFL
jgi:hypothetical protein